MTDMKDVSIGPPGATAALDFVAPAGASEPANELETALVDAEAALAAAVLERNSFRARLVAVEAKLTRTIYGVCSGGPFAYTVHWLAADEDAAEKFAATDDSYWVEKFTLYEWDRSVL